MSRFIPRKSSDVVLVSKGHEDFGRYDDIRKPSPNRTVKSIGTPSLPLKPALPRPRGRPRKRKRGIEAVNDGQAILDATPKHLDQETNNRNESPLQGFGAFPTHEACFQVTSRYIRATNSNSERLMTMNGVSSWVGLYQHLVIQCSQDQQQSLCLNQSLVTQTTSPEALSQVSLPLRLARTFQLIDTRTM